MWLNDVLCQENLGEQKEYFANSLISVIRFFCKKKSPKGRQYDGRKNFDNRFINNYITINHMDEIKLIERLKDVEVSTVCQAAIDVANNFSLEYCFRNDCQHVSSNVGIALELRDSSTGRVVEDLIEHPSRFRDLRYILNQVIQSRGLKPRGMNPYNTNIKSVEFNQYSTADEFVKKVA